MNKGDHVMNAILLGVGLGYLMEPGSGEATGASIIAIGVPVILGAMVPDIDSVIGRHRKTLHNLPVLIGFAVFPAYFGNLEYVWVGLLTHYILDIAGSTRGIALFYPLLDREYGMPVGVPVSSRQADVMTLFITAVQLALAATLVSVVGVEGFETVLQLDEIIKQSLDI